MKEINYTDFKQYKVKPLKVYTSSEANIYYNGKVLYKIYKELTREEAKRKNAKVNILSNIKGLNEAVLPIDKIVSKRKVHKTLVGISEEFIYGDTLWNLSIDNDNFLYYLKSLKSASIALKKIHNRSENIILGDANFDNIIISKDGKTHFIDFDSVMIDGLKADRISMLYDEFNRYYRKRVVHVSKNSDRLTFLLYFLNNLFKEELYVLSMYEYDEVAEKLNTLKNLRSTVVKLKRTGSGYIPYLHQVIDIKDAQNIQKTHIRKMEMR